MYEFDFKHDAFSLLNVKSSSMKVEVKERESGEEVLQKGTQFEA